MISYNSFDYTTVQWAIGSLHLMFQTNPHSSMIDARLLIENYSDFDLIFDDDFNLIHGDPEAFIELVKEKDLL